MEKEIKIKFVGSIEMAETCRRLIKKRKGFFESPAQKRFFFWQVNQFGKEIKVEKDGFWEDIVPRLEDCDKIIVLQNWKKTNGDLFYEINVLDDKGVRVSFGLSRKWEDMKSIFTYTKENPEDTAERRSEQNAGEGKSQELVYGKLITKFIRNTEAINDENVSKYKSVGK